MKLEVIWWLKICLPYIIHGLANIESKEVWSTGKEGRGEREFGQQGNCFNQISGSDLVFDQPRNLIN